MYKNIIYAMSYYNSLNCEVSCYTFNFLNIFKGLRIFYYITFIHRSLT